MSDSLRVLSDKNFTKYPLSEMFLHWGKSFDFRLEILKPENKKKAPLPLSKYFKQFPCLGIPSVLEMFQADFQKIIDVIIFRTPVSKSILEGAIIKFALEWQDYAETIISIIKSLKTPDILVFLSVHEQEISIGMLSNFLNIL